MARPKKTILIAAGASGGHLFPALAVAEELRKDGYAPVFVVGGSKFTDLVVAHGFPLERLPASAFTNRGPIKLMVAGVNLLRGLVRAFRLAMRYKPVAAFGTGGYATVATMLACKALGVPTVIHEQNVIFGRANRFLCGIVDKVCITFGETRQHLPKGCGALPLALVGTPLREEIIAARRKKRTDDGHFHLLVLGGSQGSVVLGETIPEMLAMLDDKARKRIKVVHQAKPSDVAALSAAYAKLNLGGYLVQAFFSDLPQRYVDCSLIVGRSGVGTLLEAAAIGRAAIYVPHMLADNHQLHNAQVAEKAGAAVIIQQPYFTPANLLVHVKALMADKSRLAAMEQAAKTLARVDAARDTAREVEASIHEDVMGARTGTA
jgi:UDP-N-acetylglucosamine--N-acetylmuramyl-(pentapeptide) pyrophosphoryl-undecaprenol N-acetylglucosamine transferase